jgi:hypothetical protein
LKETLRAIDDALVELGRVVRFAIVMVDLTKPNVMKLAEASKFEIGWACLARSAMLVNAELWNV